VNKNVVNIELNAVEPLEITLPYNLAHASTKSSREFLANPQQIVARSTGCYL